MSRQIHEYHPVIGYRFIPELVARVPHEAGSYLIQTNNAGFRCQHEVTLEKPKGLFRILLFGDSFTAGDGVSNQHRFGDILESRLERLQVLNFGLSGTGTDQQYLTFREFAADLEYDLLVVCPFVENIRRVISRFRIATSRGDARFKCLAKPYFELEDGELILRHVPVPKGFFDEYDLAPEDHRHVDYGGLSPALRKILKTALKPFPRLESVLAFQGVPHYDSPDNSAWLLMKAIIKQWVSESKNRPTLICPIPLYAHIEQTAPADNYRKRFQELAELDRVALCDVLPRFWAESPTDRRRCRFEHDPHFTPYGHKVMAEAMLASVERFFPEV